MVEESRRRLGTCRSSCGRRAGPCRRFRGRRPSPPRSGAKGPRCRRSSRSNRCRDTSCLRRRRRSAARRRGPSRRERSRRPSMRTRVPEGSTTGSRASSPCRLSRELDPAHETAPWKPGRRLIGLRPGGGGQPTDRLWRPCAAEAAQVAALLSLVLVLAVVIVHKAGLEVLRLR